MKSSAELSFKKEKNFTSRSFYASWQDLDFEVQGLTEHKGYLFRVAAANTNGVGDWLEAPSSIIAKMPFGTFLMTECCLHKIYYLSLT